MKKTLGSGSNQEILMSILEYKNIEIVTRVEVLAIIKKYMKVKDPVDLIEKLLKKKKLRTIKRAVYMVIPFSSINKEWSLNDLEINNYLLKNITYYIGLYNAFNIHGFTEQVPNKLFVFNTRYSFDKTVLNYRFKYFKIKKEKFFGITTKYKYPYSDKERTIIDALDYPKYLGGLIFVIDNVKKAGFNKSRLIDYAIKYKSIKIMKLVGWLTNSAKIYRVLKEKKALSYYTAIKKNNRKILNKKWKIRMI